MRTSRSVANLKAPQKATVAIRRRHPANCITRGDSCQQPSFLRGATLVEKKPSFLRGATLVEKNEESCGERSLPPKRIVLREATPASLTGGDSCCKVGLMMILLKISIFFSDPCSKTHFGTA